MSQTEKITYVSLSADNEELQRAFDEALSRVRGQAGLKTPLLINGERRLADDVLESRSPADNRLLVARASAATTKDVEDAIAAAKGSYPRWRRTPWQKRVELVEKAADIIRQRRYELSSWLILEMGKNRVEALGEIEETADLYSYYAEQMRVNNGYVHEMGRLSPTDRNTSVLRPYGVWAVIAPWNFPYALLGAPVAAALLAGNTVVAKPSTETPLSGAKIVEIFHEAGFPPGAVNLITGRGSVVGDALALHPDVAGVTFTGSYEVGFSQLYRRFASQFPKPCIVEMGGKNPAIVMDSADLDRAVLGVYRSAFGMNGHKCSACSRVYVHRKLAGAFAERLQKMMAETRIGDPSLERQAFLGPLATAASFRDFPRFIEEARQAGAEVFGGELLNGGGEERFTHGFYVRPALIRGLPRDHRLMREELFVPIVGLQEIDSLDEGLAEANRTTFGLTAGIYSQKQDEIDRFLDEIEAGVVYVNRAAGATTGAWPGVQPFGGWKGSGSTGKNIGGLYTIPTYMREQSRTVCT